MKKKNFLKCICIHKSPQIKILDYSSKYLKHVPQDIFNHERTLEVLNLDNNNISELTKELFCCKSMKELIISDNELCSIPDAIENLINLIILDVSKNNLQSLPDKIGLCSQLESLDASGNAYEELPDGICRLTMLQELMVNTSFLTDLPQNIGRLVNLRHLEARENEIKSLPENIGALANLKHLEIGNNELVNLPDSICRLGQLTTFTADKNKIQALPENFGNCRSLQTLELQNNELSTLPDSLTMCRDLTELTLTSNQLTSIPHNIGHLTHLVNLRLDNNKLTRLPESIGRLESLTQLYISSNELVDIPPSIGLLRKLRDLHADANHITELPFEIGSCVSLTVLSLRGNKIQYLPDEIGRIPHLRMINLSNNRVKFLPMSFLKLRELRAVWLNDNQIQPLVQFQSERDVDTGRKCLVCYLLPQMSNTDDPDVVENDPSAWQFVQESRPRVVQWNDEATKNSMSNSKSNKLPKDAPAKQNTAKHTLTPKHYHHTNQIISQPNHQPITQSNHIQVTQQQPITNHNQNRSSQMTNGIHTTSMNQLPPMNQQTNDFFAQQQMLWANGGIIVQPQPPPSNMFLSNHMRTNFHQPIHAATGYESDSAAVRYNRQHQIRGRQGINQSHQFLMDQIREEPQQQMMPQMYTGSGMSGVASHVMHPPMYPGSGLNSQQNIPMSGMLVGGVRQSGYSTDTGPSTARTHPRAAHNLHRTNNPGGGIVGQKAGLTSAAANAGAHYRNPYDQLRVMRARELPPSRRIKTFAPTTSTTQLLSTSSSNIVMQHQADVSLPPPPSRHPPPPPPSRPLPAAPDNTITTNTGTTMVIPPAPTRTPPVVIDNPHHPGLASISPSLITSPDDHLNLTAPNHQYTQLVVTIYRNQGLGFSITGGLSSNPNQYRPSDKGIFIAKVNPCGPADGKLQIGDKIISVNAYSFIGIEHATAVNVLKTCGNTVQMFIER